MLTSSSSYSQSRISRIQEHSISVDPNRGEKVAFELLKERPCLAVHLDRDHKVPLLLNLVKYEFLSRVRTEHFHQLFQGVLRRAPVF